MFSLFKRIQPHLTLNNAVLLCAVVITLSWLWGTVQALQRNFILEQQVAQLHDEISLSDLENQTLEFQQRYYNSPEYLELSARERLNKAAPGEKLIILPPVPERLVQAEDTQQATDLRQQSNFEQWLVFLFGANRN